MEKGAAAVMCSDGERGLTFAVVRRMLRCAVVFYRKMFDVFSNLKTIIFLIKAYVDYVTSTIRGKELFHSIDMKMTQSWDFLLWCDPSNYGGIRCLTPKDDDTEKTNPLEEGDFTFFF